MYIIGDKELSDEQARDFAAKFGGELDAIAEKYNWQYVAGDEGKTTVPAETTLPTGPEKKTAAGDSSLADTSLESPEIDLLPGLQYAAEKDLFSVDETEGRKRLEAYFVRA